ncbi:triacylglycerol lipase [Moniliophthora roreri MCA 2997]|uniref:GPI inositol-deacylase n=1 Tax=Moniliophthora roreri (strain MCA 2997) TaxID=1381753 RepID=V2XWF4_MONRO|nr:triacylglycerol lipase [Moniliophthora roreri MCA 2997]
MTSTTTPTPVLRWLGTWSPYGSRPHSPNSSPSDSQPPSPSLVSLNEALHEPLELPKPPPPARPSSFYASRNLTRNPPYLDNLTRSTLPTASLSAAPQCSNSSRSPSPRSLSTLPAPSIKPSHSPPTRTSLETLRSVSRRDSSIRHSNHGRSVSSTSVTLLDEDDGQSKSPTNTSWWWFQTGNKSNVDNLLGEDDRADTVQEEQAKIRKKYRSPKNPVVFCHGLLGFDSVTIGPSIAPLEVTHWRGIKEVLEANGTEVLITRVPATSSPVDRAKVLEARISEVYPGRSVHLIGHSMGGLDCRYLTTHLTQRKFTVLSITTIATPHRGSSFADHFLSTLGRERMPSFIQLLDLLPNGGGDGKAFECLTVESMRKFNEQVPDVEGVKYFSWGAVYDPGFVDTWKWPHSIILEKEGPNDGLVSVDSAKWGKYLGTLEGVNHLDLVGWINTARYKWAEMTGREIKFRPATFYLGIADMLAKEVEGQGPDDEGDQAGIGAAVHPPSPPPASHHNSDEHSNAGSTKQAPAGPTKMLFAGDGGNAINHSIEAPESPLSPTRNHRPPNGVITRH